MEETTFEEVNSYKNWIKGEGIPIINGYYLEDVMKVPVRPWRRMGGKGAYLDLFGSQNWTGAYVCEIPPGGTLNPEKHLFEELIYVFSGKGTSSVWSQATPKQTFEWQEGSLFSPPLNFWHQLANQSSKPARFLAVTGAPVSLNLFHNSEFIFNNDFVFKDRYAGQSDYFTREGRVLVITNDGNLIPEAFPGVLEKNLIRNVLELLKGTEIREWDALWKGGKHLNMVLSENTMEFHIEEEEPGTYMKAHRHHGGAHLLVLGGQGYSLMWPDHGEKHRFDWHKGSILVPPERWWHTHFITGTEPAIMLALRWLGNKYTFNRDWKPGKPDQLEYDEEDPEMRTMFEAELDKEGLKSRMDESLYGEKG